MDRANLQKEVSSLSSEIDRIAESANFNGIKLLNGDLSKKSTGLSDANGNINVADGITINAPVDGAGKKHAMEVTISAGLFNKGDKIDMTVVDADGNEKAVSLEFNASAVSANGQFKGTTAEEQAQGIADAINATYTGDGKELEGYTASAAVDAETGEMKITLTANAEGAGKVSLKTGEGGKINITDKRVGIPTDGGITPTVGVDTASTAFVTGLGTTIVPLGFDTAGTALDINEGDTLKFSLNVNGQDQTVTLKAVSGTAALGQNEFRVGNGQHLAEVLTNIKDTLATATFDNAEGTKAIDESKLKVSDFFNVGTDDNALTFSTKPGIPNNADITNYGVSGIKLYAAGTGAGTDAVPAGGLTGAMNGLTIKSDTTNHSLGELADGDTITISGVNGDGNNFEVKLTAKNTGAVAGEFNIGVDKNATLNSIVDALKNADTTVTITGGTPATATGAVFFHDTTGQFKITANTFSGQINFETETATAPDAASKANSVVKFENAYNEGDKFTIRGTLHDGSSFSVELTATNSAGTLGANEFKIGADLNETLDNIKNTLEKDTTAVRINDASSTVKGKDIFGAGKEITIQSPERQPDATINNTAAQLTFESAVAGKVGKGGASGVGDVTVNASAEMEAAAGTKEPGKEAGKASNTLTFDADKIEQGTTLTIGGNTYEFVTDEKYLSKDGPEGNIAITVADLGKKDADGNTIVSDEDIAKAVYKALTGTAAAETGDTSKDLVGAKDENGRPLVDGSGNAMYKVNYAAGSNSITIESLASGTGAEALKDVAISSTKQDTSVVKFTTTTEGYGNNKKTTLNVKAGDSVTIEGKTYEFVEAGKRTKDENAIAVELDFAGTAKDAADALAKAVNDTTVAADDKSYNVLATANDDGSITLVSRFNPNVKTEDAYAAPEVEVSKTAGGLTLQVGETSEDFQKVNVAIDKMDAKSLGIGDINVGTQEGAAAAIDKIKTAINTVSSTRGDLGAIQNRLEHTINNLGVTTENMTAAESRIRDTDMAKEMMEFTKNNILVQASQAMLAQANQLPQGVLQLLQ